ncbi:MAG: hypothetical protein ABIR66_00465, partial [Saprospiraceae bacterium]
KVLSEINDGRHTVIKMDIFDSVDPSPSLPTGLVDIVISAIPSSEVHMQQVIQDSYDQLKEGGQFIQIQYSTLAKKLYERIFGEVQIKFLPFNIPPAFLFIMCKSIKSLD